jgi:hypothetical protein
MLPWSAAQLVSEPDFSKWKPYPKATHPQKGLGSRLQQIAQKAGLQQSVAA